MSAFYGRQRELSLLKELLEKRIASLAVITGRRRIGKTRLIDEFGKGLRKLAFSGLPPEEGISAQMERDHFAKQLEQQTGFRSLSNLDWDDLFWNLAQICHKGRILLVLDEINWMAMKDPTFLGKLKTVWDMHFSKNPKLILILSGSMAGWIEKNILKSTGFFGRVTLELKLEELPLSTCNYFWGAKRDEISSYEKFKLLSVMGGVPKYLEEIHPELSSEENIRRLCFRKEGFLFREYDRICTELFAKRGAVYERILKRLSEGRATQEELFDSLEMEKSGVLSDYLEDLEMIGYTARENTWHIKEGKISPQSQYRLCDNYLRFYLRYIAPHKKAIELGAEPKLPTWYSIMGLQFENLVLNNRKSLFKLLNIPIEDVLIDNPYFQKPTQTQPGCQIDYLIQTRFQNLYICEIKFQKDEIPKGIVNEVKVKMENLTLPKGFSKRAVLIHVNGVADSLIESDFFAHILDFGALLKEL